MEPAASRTPLLRFTLLHEWLVILGVSAASNLLLAFAAGVDPEALQDGSSSGFSWVSAILFALGHAAWISMDRARRGKPVGVWRFGAILLGPLAIWLHLLLEYRWRAVYLIPLSVVCYLMAVLPGTAAAVLLREP